MSNEISTSKDSSSISEKKSGGGTAIGGGVNFQAITTAIVAVHILRGTPIGWLDGVHYDIPLAVWAESEGPGDDIRIEFKDNVIGEAQVKKGLQRGKALWASLEAMALAIDQKKISYAVLVVASDSSNTIRKDLADDIKRLGQDRVDHLTDIGKDWQDRLLKLNISASSVCSYMRVRVIYGLSHEDTNILAAKEALRYVCMNKNDVDKVWDALYRHSVQLIENRGRWELKDLLQILSSINIRVRNDDFSASILNHQAEWVKENNSYFFITGIKRKISIKHLLPMKLEKIPFNSFHAPDVSTALSNYQKTVECEQNFKAFDSVWIGRFIKRVVIVAGPGLGKSTMLRELAHQYAQDGYLVLKIDLKKIAVALKRGESFSESLVILSLDGSRVTPEQVRIIPLSNWVILADGLDECGTFIHDVAQQISHFLQGHSDVRIIITTRPIGYTTAEFESWSHYRLLPPVKNQGAKNLAHLMTVIDHKDSSEAIDENIAKRELGHSLEADLLANSPQLLGMAASLIHRYQSIPESRTQLYQQLISLFDDIPKEQEDSQQEVYDLVINIVGWTLIDNPLIDSKELIKVSAAVLAKDIDKTKFEAAVIVKESLKHWEKFGLIEKINYQSSSLIIFIHKTFSEFMAARFLYDNHQDYLEEIIDKPKWNEVINFAIGIGLADEVIKLKLQRHHVGESGSLRDALSLLCKHSINISDPVAQKLIHQAVLVINSSGEERFILGVCLSDIVAELSKDDLIIVDIIMSAVSSWLRTSNNELNLIAWGIAVKSKHSYFDAEILSNVLKEARSYVTIPSIIHMIKDKKDRSNIDLLERIALAALKSQSDDKIKEFYYSELKGQDFLSLGTSIACETILKYRGIVLEESLFSRFNSSKSSTLRIVRDDSAFNAPWHAYYAIAKAIVNSYQDPFPIHHNNGNFPNFAGLLSASGFLKVPVSYIYNFDVKYEERAFSSIMKSIIELLPIDLFALQNEAIELINILENDPSLRVLNLLPKVDIFEVEWEKSTDIHINKEDLKKMLFHPSNYVASLATNFFIYHPLNKGEIISLLTKADGFTLAIIFILANEHFPNDAFEMISVYLEFHTSVDLTYLLETLQEIKKIPTQKLVEEVLILLSSDKDKTVVSATNLLSHWIDLGVAVDQDPIIKAIEFWQSQEKYKKNVFIAHPLSLLIELKDKIINN